MEDKIVHEGKNVKRIREILGKKQDELAVAMGITQQAVSLLEGKETIDPKLMEDVAKVLHVTPEAIRNFKEDAAVNIISNQFHDESTAYAYHYKCTFNPIDRVVELYERLIKERDEQIEKLRKK